MISLIKKINFWHLAFLIAIYYICRFSFGQAINSYFWKDDWAWLWAANYNPADFYHTTIGGDWYIRTGLFMYGYVLYLFKYIHDPFIWQIIGLLLKVVNSIAFYFLIESLTGRKYLGVIGALLLASYSGGIESYTWYKLSALSATFVILGLAFYGKFLKSLRFTNFLASLCFLILAFMSNMGRPAGVIPLIMFWSFLEIIKREQTANSRWKIFFSALVVAVPYLLLTLYINKSQSSPPGYYLEALRSWNVYLGIIGNLLKNPFVKYFELGYLCSVDSLGKNLGIILLGVNLLFFIIYLVKRIEVFKLLTLFCTWIFIFYIPNWVFGGGGISTILGSGHRYLTLSGIGLIGLWTILLGSISRRYAVFLTPFIIFMNLNYSRHLTDLESSVRNKYLVKPIYQELHEYMKNDSNVQLVVIDAPNYLKSFVVGGWYPYTYSYYKGVTKIEDFPVVIGFWEHATKWVCADKQKKLQIQATGGFGSNRKEETLNPEHVYAWHLEVSGKLSNKTAQIRSIVQSCNTLEDKKNII